MEEQKKKEKEYDNQEENDDGNIFDDRENTNDSDMENGNHVAIHNNSINF